MHKCDNCILTYPQLPVSEIKHSPAIDLWLPTFPKYSQVNTLYVFYTNSDLIYYAGKTTIGRPRWRWHLQNTFVAPDDWYDLNIDILTIQSDTPLEQLEAKLIINLLPLYNRSIKNVALRYRKMIDEGRAYPDQALRKRSKPTA